MPGLVLMLTLLAVGQTAPDGADTVRQIVAASGAEVAVAFRTLDGRDELLIDADKPFHAASTMKVPIMIELFRKCCTRPDNLLSEGGSYGVFVS